MPYHQDWDVNSCLSKLTEIDDWFPVDDLAADDSERASELLGELIRILEKYQTDEDE